MSCHCPICAQRCTKTQNPTAVTVARQKFRIVNILDGANQSSLLSFSARTQFYKKNRRRPRRLIKAGTFRFAAVHKMFSKAVQRGLNWNKLIIYINWRVPWNKRLNTLFFGTMWFSYSTLHKYSNLAYSACKRLGTSGSNLKNLFHEKCQNEM